MSDANTRVIIPTHDFREGYVRGRHDYFTQDEGIVHTEDDLLDLLKAHAKDNLYLGREQSTLREQLAVRLANSPGGSSRSPNRNNRTSILRRRSSV